MVRKPGQSNEEEKNETAGQNEPDEGKLEEKKYQKKPEKIEGGKEVFHLITGVEPIVAL